MSTSELAWFKSSYSSSGSGDCVEVALDWRKSSYSSGGDGDCIEIAAAPHHVHVRDSKDKDGLQLTLSSTAWAEFVAHAAE
ncbi:DUF397 domain-containing protein [Streptomyces bobili]|uniref:DUF397 domain-containing protein n=1 Tax=Streptomyces bobili TaxID=67280 RepID=A0ABZ1R3U1_9ACTN|nr:DUF397 domain-containing protein [Streptomyces bobili]